MAYTVSPSFVSILFIDKVHITFCDILSLYLAGYNRASCHYIHHMYMLLNILELLYNELILFLIIMRYVIS